MRRRLGAPALAIAVVVLTAGCGSGHRAAARVAPASPPRLKSVAELRSVFNRGPREPTLVVLISPT